MAAGIVVAAMIALALRAQTSFAEVATAAASKGLGFICGEYTMAKWPAKPGMRLAGDFRFALAGNVEYRDYRLEAYYSYNTKQQILYRLPEVQNPQVPFEPMTLAIMARLKQERRSTSRWNRSIFWAQSERK